MPSKTTRAEYYHEETSRQDSARALREIADRLDIGTKYYCAFCLRRADDRPFLVMSAVRSVSICEECAQACLRQIAQEKKDAVYYSGGDHKPAEE